MTKFDTGKVIFFYVISCCSIIATIGVLASLLHTRVMRRRSAVMLILYLNASQLLQDVVSFPYYMLTTVSGSVCKSLAFFRAYSELMDISVCFCMVLTNYLLIFDERYKTLYFSRLDRRIVVFLCVFPLVSLLSFITNTYGRTVIGACSFRGNRSNDIWAVALLYSWVWAIILATIFTFIYVWRKLKFEPRLQGRYFRSLGIYSLVSIIAWIPRSIVGMSQFLGLSPAYLAIEVSHFLTYLVGLAYAVVYCFERHYILQFATEPLTTSEINLDSWEKSFGSLPSSERSGARPSEPNVYQATLMQVSNEYFGDVSSPLAGSGRSTTTSNSLKQASLDL